MTPQDVPRDSPGIYLAISRLATGDVNFDTQDESPARGFPDVPLIPLLIDMAYSVIVSDLYQDKQFLISVPEHDEIATFNLENGAIHSISLSTHSGLNRGRIDLREPVGHKDIFRALQGVLKRALPMLEDDARDVLFSDPISKAIVSRAMMEL